MRQSIQLHSPEIFAEIDRRSHGELANWLASLAQYKEFTDIHPFAEVDPDDPTAAATIDDLPPLTLPYIVKAMLQERESWLRSKQQQGGSAGWNGSLRIGPGPGGYCLYVTDKLSFTPDENGHLPPILVSDGTINKHYLGMLYDLDQALIAEDREQLQVAPNTVLVEPTNAPRYGKSSLLTPKKDKNGTWQLTDLRRAIGHARYLLNKHDPGGQARAADKVGLISFKDCVDSIGDALNIPQYRRMWFWGSRGSNALEDCSILLLVGTPALAPEEVEEYARDLHRQDLQPIEAGRVKDPATERERFKDPRVQALADHLTNGETTQCAHRCRAIQHEGRTIINLGHGVIGEMAGATIIPDELPAQITPTGQEKKQANLEQAIQKLIAAYQRLLAAGVSVTVDLLQRAAGVRREQARQWLYDKRQAQTDVRVDVGSSQKAKRDFSSTLGNASMKLHYTQQALPTDSDQREQEEASPPPRVYPPGEALASASLAGRSVATMVREPAPVQAAAPGATFARKRNVARAILSYGQSQGYPMLNVGYISIESGRAAWCRWTEEASQEDQQAVYQSVTGPD